MNDRLLKRLILKEINSVLNEQHQDRQEKAIRDFAGALMGLGMLVPHMDDRQNKMYDRLKDLANNFMETFDVELGGDDDEGDYGSESPGNDEDY